MTLEEAIKILTYSSEQNTILITGDDKDALKLGIEALKAINQEPPCGVPCWLRPLPGETKD